MIKKVEEIVDAIESRKGSDILVYDLEGKGSIADYYIICSGSSNRMRQAISDEVDKRVNEFGEEKLGLEGYGEGNWILMDFDDVLVHIFDNESREKYNFEGLLDGCKELYSK